MRDAENHGLDRAHSFSNEDGFEEWMTCDANGNEVHCYDNGSVEIHTKEPLCRFCAVPLVKASRKTWKCPQCSKRRTYEGINKQFYRLADYTYGSHPLCDDYGAFMNHDEGTTYMVGPNELYTELTSGY